MIFWFPSCAGAQTAWDMLHEEEMFPRITTSCVDLDNILGGGINCKEVTEIGSFSSSLIGIHAMLFPIQNEY